DIHGHSSKEEHKITIGSSGQFSPSIEQKMFMILPWFECHLSVSFSQCGQSYRVSLTHRCPIQLFKVKNFVTNL
ncbi:hypothetical protein KCN56_15515, partial [Photobacterium galatheae]